MNGYATTCSLSATTSSLSASTSFVSDFQWPEELLDGWRTHKQYLENGSFYLHQVSDDGGKNEKILHCRSGDHLIEEKGPDGVRVEVFRSGSFFAVSKLNSSRHWELRQLSPTPENRVLTAPFVYFAYTMLATEFPDDNDREYTATTPFNPKETFTVEWRVKANPKIHGSLVFDPKVAWGCVELRYINTESIEAKFIGRYDGTHLESVRIEDPKAPETFSLVKFDSNPAPAELFTLEHYGLSETLLGDTPKQPNVNFVLWFGILGVVLLLVSLWLRKSGSLKGA